MKFAKWNSQTRYAEHTAPGWIPQGTQVKCTDGTIGTVVNGNGGRSLVEYHPKRDGGWQREWFDNDTLKVAE